MLASPLPSSFLNTYNLLCHLGDIRPYASSSDFLSSYLFVLVLLLSIKHYSVNLTRGIVQMFTSLMRFLLQSLLSRSFIRSSQLLFYYYFFFISACWRLSASNISVYYESLLLLLLFYFFESFSRQR